VLAESGPVSHRMGARVLIGRLATRYVPNMSRPWRAVVRVVDCWCFWWIWVADLPEPYGLKPVARKTTVKRQYVKRRSMAHLLRVLKKLRLNMVDEMIDYTQVLFRVMSYAYLMLQTMPPTDEYAPFACALCRVRIATSRLWFSLGGITAGTDSDSCAGSTPGYWGALTPSCT